MYPDTISYSKIALPGPRLDIKNHIETLETAHAAVCVAIQSICTPFTNITWLQTRFPNAKMTNVPGLCKVVTRLEVAQRDYSLTPGRYVGAVPSQSAEINTIDTRLREIREELSVLNEEAIHLAKTIDANLHELLS